MNQQPLRGLLEVLTRWQAHRAWSVRPPAGEPSSRMRTVTPASDLARSRSAMAGCSNVYAAASIDATAEPNARDRTSNPASGVTARVTGLAARTGAAKRSRSQPG